MVWISRLYIFFVGIILTLTTGFGIAAFYPEPQGPIYPVRLEKPLIAESCYSTPEQARTAECQKMIAERETENTEFQKKQDVYRNASAQHTRTTIFFGITIGTLFTLLGLAFIKNSSLIANGLLLAGVLTMVLTRFTVMIASFGSFATGTEGATNIGLIQFGILVILSILTAAIGYYRLRE